MPEPLTHCPNCGSADLDDVHAVAGVPAHSMLLLHDPDAARAFPTGDIVLAVCGACGFVTNRAYDPALESYDAEYEASQAFSPTFNAFHQALADDLIARYDLHGKEVVEIGCGQGEFLRLLCQRGGNRGLGFDPGFANAHGDADGETVRVVADYFGPHHPVDQADFVCCKQTLEHIPDTRDFVANVRRTLRADAAIPVFFQVPDFERIIVEGAFWDVYYEHCSYFTAPSLIRVFQDNGFDVQACRSEYDDQYLMIEATPVTAATGRAVPGVEAVVERVRGFAEACAHQRACWADFLQAAAARGERVALWGGGSEAVAFLTTLVAGPEVAYAVDVNPRKQGCYLPTTAHEVVAPERLVDQPVDIVIAMNPIYLSEIGRDLERLGVAPRLLSVAHFQTESQPALAVGAGT
jgi:SAM-dependent methyltransferase